MEINEITPDGGVRAVYPVVRQLRTHLEDAEAFVSAVGGMRREGYRLAAAYRGGVGDPVGVAGFRVQELLAYGRILYVDDLVTADRWRSHGYGRLLNKYLVERARGEGCGSIQLDSGVHRGDAHRFYFREQYRVTSFHFGRYFGDGAPTPEPPKDPR